MAEYIEREAIIKEATFMFDTALGYCKCVLVEDIEAQPTADVVEIVHGEWTYKTNSNERLGGTDATYDYECSVCNELALEESNYCPNCGAKMDGLR